MSIIEIEKVLKLYMPETSAVARNFAANDIMDLVEKEEEEAMRDEEHGGYDPETSLRLNALNLKAVAHDTNWTEEDLWDILERAHHRGGVVIIRVSGLQVVPRRE